MVTYAAPKRSAQMPPTRYNPLPFRSTAWAIILSVLMEVSPLAALPRCPRGAAGRGGARAARRGGACSERGDPRLIGDHELSIVSPSADPHLPPVSSRDGAFQARRETRAERACCCQR